MIFDIVVVGAGPSGASVAYHSAKRGLNVAIIEREIFPRYKPCGGVVAIHVEKILDFPLTPVVEQRISRMLISFKLKKRFVSDFGRPFVYMVMRDKFDQFLVDKAQSAGARVYYENLLVNIEKNNEGYCVKTDKNCFYAKYIIAADGANSNVRNLLGIPAFHNVSVALDREIYAPKLDINKWNNTLVLDFGWLESGYGWIFPKKNNFSLGVGGARKVSRQLLSYYNKLFNKFSHELNLNDVFFSKGHRLPIRKQGESLVYENVILVGDAAGLIDPLSGEGIYYSIRSGQIAADVVYQNKNDQMSLITYEERIDKEIQPELEVSKVMLMLLDSAPSFWIPFLLRENNPFFQYYCKIFTGEHKYQDFPKKFGLIGVLFFYLMTIFVHRFYER